MRRSATRRTKPLRSAVVVALAVVLVTRLAAAVPVLVEDQRYYGLHKQVLPLTYGFDDGGSQTWVVTQKSVIQEALDEWDEWLCYGQSFFIQSTYTVSFQWTSMGGGGVAYYDPSDEEIYFNSDRTDWHIGLGSCPTGEVDFLSVAKHEIGHSLGIVGDYGRVDADGVGEWFDDANGNGSRDAGEKYYDTNANGQYDANYVPPVWAKSDEIMWGLISHGQELRTIKQSDLRELRGMDYHVVPEPCSLALLAFGVAGLIGIRVKRRAR